MANEEHLKILKQGVEIWNKWRAEIPGLFPNLVDAELSGENLSFANLSNVDLRGANLPWANLKGAFFSTSFLNEVNMGGANLNGAELFGVDLSKANLSGADLSGAFLNGAVLNETSLKGADFNLVYMGKTILAKIDLSAARNLEAVVHMGPSTIGIDTLYRSQGKISEVFLRGAGVPEELIAYLPSLISGKAIQYYSCFISYSSKDQEFAERLHADLQARGVRVWFAPEDIKGGRKLHEQIPEAIRLYDKLLLVLSENSMQSEWVKTEIYHARQNEIRDNCRKLFPIGLVEYPKIKAWEAFDADSGKDMAREIREYFIPNFSNWKDHDAYKIAFDRLLGDLNLDAEK